MKNLTISWTARFALGIALLGEVPQWLNGSQDCKVIRILTGTEGHQSFATLIGDEALGFLIAFAANYWLCAVIALVYRGVKFGGALAFNKMKAFTITRE